MKILLDECLDWRLKKSLEDFTVISVADMNWKGIKNGNLMSLAIDNGFDIFLTVDKNLEFQQNLKRYAIALVVLDSKSNNIRSLLEFIPSFKSQVKDFEKGKSYRISQ